MKTRDILAVAQDMDTHEIPFRLVIYEGDGHSLSNHRAEALEQVIGWFDRFLRPESSKRL